MYVQVLCILNLNSHTCKARTLIPTRIRTRTRLRWNSDSSASGPEQKRGNSKKKRRGEGGNKLANHSPSSPFFPVKDFHRTSETRTVAAPVALYGKSLLVCYRGPPSPLSMPANQPPSGARRRAGGAYIHTYILYIHTSDILYTRQNIASRPSLS